MTQKLNLLFQFKSRRVSIMAEAIVLVIAKLHAKAEEKDDTTFWGEACQDLGIANSNINRKRLKHAYHRHRQVIKVVLSPFQYLLVYYVFVKKSIHS